MSALSSTIQEKIDLKLITEAKSLLQHQGIELSSEQYDSFQQQITHSLARADALVKKAKSAEQRGNVEEALNMLNQAKLIAADLPGLQQELLHMNDAVQLTRTFKTKALKRQARKEPEEPKSGKRAGVSVFLSVISCIIIASAAFYLFTGGQRDRNKPAVVPGKQDTVTTITMSNPAREGKDEQSGASSPEATSTIDQQDRLSKEIKTAAQQQPVKQDNNTTPNTNIAPPPGSAVKDAQLASIPKQSTVYRPTDGESAEKNAEITAAASPEATSTIDQQDRVSKEIKTAAQQQPVKQDNNTTPNTNIAPPPDSAAKDAQLASIPEQSTVYMATGGESVEKKSTNEEILPWERANIMIGREIKIEQAEPATERQRIKQDTMMHDRSDHAAADVSSAEAVQPHTPAGKIREKEDSIVTLGQAPPQQSPAVDDQGEKTLVQETPPQHANAPVFYTVKPGDSLSTIAYTLFCNERERIKLLILNQDTVTDPRKILPGTRIRLQSDTITIENRCRVQD